MFFITTRTSRAASSFLFQNAMADSSTLQRHYHHRNHSNTAAAAFINPITTPRVTGPSQRVSSFTSLSSQKGGTSTDTITTGRTRHLVKDEEVMNDLLLRIRECNHIPSNIRNDLLDLVIDDVVVGKTTKAVAKCLCNTPSTISNNPVFEIKSSSSSSSRSVLTLTKEAGTTLQSRTDAVGTIMQTLRQKNIITGWRDELLPLSKGFYEEPLLLVERAAAPFLGMVQYGVHINGFVCKEDEEGETMWMARRSMTKSKYPGMLDHIVAGGQPAGIGLMENVLKECMEEAGISEEITLSGIQASGAISYEGYEKIDGDGGHDAEIDGVISRSVLFCYDLELPLDFEPKVVDGEVEEFFLWTLEEVVESMRKVYHDPIKPNCYLVIIDFLLRRGYISPETPGYLDVLRELRDGYCG